MNNQAEAIKGLQAYQGRDYITSLKHFSKSAPTKTNDAFQALSAQTLEAVANLQLCNYNQAGQQLASVYQQILQQQQRGTQSCQMMVLKVKVLCNLVVLELVSCGERVRELLEQMMKLVRSWAQQQRESGKALFRVMVRSLFGFDSFKRIEEEYNQLLVVLGSQSKLKPHPGNDSIPSPLLISSLSLYCHLSGNIKPAFLLQKYSYGLTKGKQLVPSILSLKHLEELAKELRDDKSSKQYRNQLILAMGEEQLEGVAEETLFRNYRKKIDIARDVVKELIMFEQEWGPEPEANDFDRLAVTWKLKRAKASQGSDSIEQVLALVQQNQNILAILGGSEFVQSAKREYAALVLSLSSILTKTIQHVCWESLISHSTIHNQSVLVSSNEPSLERNDLGHELSFRSNNCYKQRRPYESSLNQRQSRSRSRVKQTDLEEHSEREKESRTVASNHFANRTSMLPGRQEEKNNNVYKIGKGNPKDRQKKVERGKQAEVKSAVQPEQKGENLFGQTIIGQFIKQPNEVKIESEVLPQKASELKTSQQASQLQQFNIIKEEQEEIPLVPKETPLPQSRIKIETSQTQQIKPKPNELPAVEEISETNQIMTLSQLKLKQSQTNIHKSNLSMLHTSSSKLKRMISLCQTGQYIEKRHFSSDGGAQRFLMLAKGRDKIFWGESEEAIDISSSSSSYLLQDIKGIVYGKVTATMRKQCNFKLQAWKCFSLILKKRTFDVYLPEERDLFFWLPGLSLCLKDLDYSAEKYQVEEEKHLKREKVRGNVVVLGDRQVDRFYSVGRILWKRFLLRIKTEYLPYKKHEKYHSFGCPNAYAIVVAAVRKMKYKQQKMKRYVS